MFLNYFALGVLIFVFLVIFYGIIILHDIPYLIAKKRNHPHADAIHVVKPNITIGTKSFGIDELFRDGFKAISIGTGVTWPNKLNIKGETLGHVHYGVHYLESPEVQI